MYCSTCGVALAQGLSYCNYCGAKLNGPDTGSSKARLDPLIFAILATFVFGTFSITVFIGVLKAALRLDNDEVMALAVVPFLVMLVLEFVFVRLLLRRARTDDDAGTKVRLKGQATKELDAAHAHALPEPVGSITENTTRAFDPVYTRRNSK
ncbi:MAG TPA: hypothetical protein VNO50_08380 [Pyrinomonadaceae bacterium]|nr:hypothetical protein [Pyrinomonadaceae bacterium]